MKQHALIVIFEKAAKFENCHLLQIVGGALWANANNHLQMGCIVPKLKFQGIYCIYVDLFMRKP